jgi:GcrA cell cycle regulator
MRTRPSRCQAGERNCTQVEAMTAIGAQGTWTTERIALLKDRIDAGLSCGQIAREIGVSRNAVIGKANRLGLSRLKRVGHRERTGDRGPARSRNATLHRTLLALWATPPLAFAATPEDSANLCPLFELQQWHCRWPIGDPTAENFGFCGSKQVDSLPYCAAHARMAYRRAPARPAPRELKELSG